MLKSLCIAICAFGGSGSAFADIYKCQKEKNETVYQNFPCHIDSIGSTATAAPPTEGSAAAGRGANAAANQPLPIQRTPIPGVAGDTSVARTDDGKYEPRIGMTRRQVRRLSWGEPADITRTDEGEYVWTYPDKRVLRFDDKGRLVSVQR